jgi:hypothetical protein
MPPGKMDRDFSRKNINIIYVQKGNIMINENLLNVENQIFNRLKSVKYKSRINVKKNQIVVIYNETRFYFYPDENDLNEILFNIILRKAK